MANITNSEYRAQLEACDWLSDDAMDLIVGRHTNMKINDSVRERHFGACDGYGYFANFYNVAEWGDEQGQDELREIYFHPNINQSFQYFQRTMQICDPRSADECRTDYCKIPTGGYGQLPPIEMYKWGLETDRSCVGNLRHIRAFREWAQRVADVRFYADQQIMQMFYTLATIRMTGHKFVLEAQKDSLGNYIPFPDANPRNPLGGWKYSWLNPLFPAVDNPANIMPLSLDILQQLARRWTLFNNQSWVATGHRGDKIFEFWYPDDWYDQEVLQDGDNFEKLRTFMPNKLFAGYSLDPDGEREVIGNWAMRSMPCLPRFTESCEGGLTIVDMHQNVDVEIGQEAIESRQWQNAPFLLCGSFDPSMGSIMTRPTLNTSAEGWPILPIMGNGDWRIRNEYDKECNPDMNMPYSQKRYEMGFRVDDPWASIAFIVRSRLYRTAPLNTCDLQPVFKITPVAPCDDIVGIGCEDNSRRHQAEITQKDLDKHVKCMAEVCGNASGGQQIYRLQLEREALVPNFNPLSCDCGDTLVVNVYDETQTFSHQQEAEIVEILKPGAVQAFSNAEFQIWVRTTTLAADHCIKGVFCKDATPQVSDVRSCWTSDGTGDCPAFTGTKMALEHVIQSAAGVPAAVGDTVNVEYFDASGTSLGTIAATIAEINEETLVYRLTSVDPDFDCDGGFTDVASITVTVP